MSDPDHEDALRRLAETPVPPASQDARQRAVAAAGAAFDAVFAEASAENLAASAKGPASPRRPTSSAHSGWWRTNMHTRTALGSVAAGALVLPLAAVILLRGQVIPLSPPPFGDPAASHSPAKSDRNATAGKAEQDKPSQAVSPPQDNITLSGSPIPSLAYNDATSQSQIFVDVFNENETTVQATPPAGSVPAAAPPLTPPAPSAEARAVGQTAQSIVPAFKPTLSMDLKSVEGAALRQQEVGRDRFVGKPQNGVTLTAQSPVSTFSIDTDTASYAWVRQALARGALPSPEQVRIEEMVNYFPYDYALPDDRATPFRPSVSVVPTPWNARTKLVHIGIKGFDVAPATRPRANLVFLVDTSGSMDEPGKLPLVQSSLKLLLDRLQPSDTVAIVTYAGDVGVALEPTKASDRARIAAAIDGLGAAGATAGAAGIETAYDLARRSFVQDGVNRVILATDGDFNVGRSDDDSLTQLIETERKSGVFLSVLGFGQGNYNDGLMQRLAQNGNGTAAYIDGLDEAQKVLVDEASSTLFPIAKDVKIQVEFNPAKVSAYRLIGYETRMLERADFNDDRIDAGEVGSGTAVTALYEITPAGSEAQPVDALRYGAKPAPPAAAPAATEPASSEYAYLKIRYKLPTEDESHLIAQPISTREEAASIDAASADVRFATAVAAFGERLKSGTRADTMSYDAIIALAEGARGDDKWGYRNGFVRLARLAKSLDAR